MLMLLTNGCASLKPVTYNGNTSLIGYKYAYNYGETGRRNVFWGYTIEITLQILSADTLEVLCTTTAEGMGSTEADDIRIAITRAMEAIFPN